MRVLLADDEPKVRSALRLALEQMKWVETVDECCDAQSLSDCLRATSPDLLLLDWELPGLHPGPSVSEIRKRNRWMKVVVLSGHYQSSKTALASGADAFVSKGEPPERLFAALRALGAD